MLMSDKGNGNREQARTFALGAQKTRDVYRHPQQLKGSGPRLICKIMCPLKVYTRSYDHDAPPHHQHIGRSGFFFVGRCLAHNNNEVWFHQLGLGILDVGQQLLVNLYVFSCTTL